VSDDTIVAVATPPGRGGIAVARLSGPAAHAIALALAERRRPFVARRVTRVSLRGLDVPDDALVTYFQGPASYTGEDVVEISTHGSPAVMAAVVAACTARGARAAGPGEFTLRAYLNGKLDLLQAEAVHDLVSAVSPAAARAAAAHLDGALSTAMARIVAALRDLHLRLEASMDFPEEGYHFIDAAEASTAVDELCHRVQALVDGSASARRVLDGARVVVAGAPNVGKSSVFNALLGAERAIVTPVAGTTRDLVSEHVLVGAAHLRLIDSAGQRAAGDEVEQEGMRRAAVAAQEADVVLVVLDRSRPLDADDRRVLESTRGRVRLVAANKIDLPAAWDERESAADVAVSAQTGEGIAALAARVADLVASERSSADVLVSNQRQVGHLRRALGHLQHARAALTERGGALPEEFLAADLLAAQDALHDLIGARAPDDVLAEIFAKFCIGK
jgi:tRNA modification GTPase